MGIVYLLNGVDGNSLAQGILTNQKMLKFGLGGKYVGESPFSYSYSRLREIDLVSIINVNNCIEVAYNIDKVFNKGIVGADVSQVVRWGNNHPKLVFVGLRNLVYSDNIGNVPYAQYFFGFEKGVITEKELREVMKIDG